MLKPFQVTFMGLLVLTSGVLLSSTKGLAQAPADSNLTIDRDFELNIDQERIQRQDYQASTSVRLGEAREQGLSLQVGAEVQASQIDLQLNNITGRVRFQADLESLRERVRSLQSN